VDADERARITCDFDVAELRATDVGEADAFGGRICSELVGGLTTSAGTRSRSFQTDVLAANGLDERGRRKGLEKRGDGRLILIKSLSSGLWRENFVASEN
jgi:hypothetical protein